MKSSSKINHANFSFFCNKRPLLLLIHQRILRRDAILQNANYPTVFALEMVPLSLVD